MAGLERSSTARLTGHSDAILVGRSGLRSWEHIPVVPITAKPIAVARVATAVNSPAMHNNVTMVNNWAGQSRGIGAQPSFGSMGSSGNRRVPVKIMPPALPRIAR